MMIVTRLSSRRLDYRLFPMRHKRLGTSRCPIARSLDRVGDWWNILIIRDALHGLTRFDQFQKSLGIPPTTLTRRLAALVDARLLERRPYSTHPPRDEYLLTEAGRDFRGVLVMLLAWGNRHFSPDGVNVVVRDTRTRRTADPIVVDRRTREPLEAATSRFAPGPAADDTVKRRFGVVARDPHSIPLANKRRRHRNA